MNIRQKNNHKPQPDTKFLSPKTITTITQQINWYQRNHQKTGAFIHGAYCVNFSENDLTADEFRLLVADLKTHFKTQFRIVVYPNPLTPQENKKWLEANASLISELQETKQFFVDVEYQKTPERQEAAKDFDQVWETNQSRKNDLASKAADGFLNRGNNSELYKRTECVTKAINESIDVLSFIPKDSEQENDLHIILSNEKALLDLMNETISENGLKTAHRKLNSHQTIRQRKLTSKHVRSNSSSEELPDVFDRDSDQENSGTIETSQSRAIPVPKQNVSNSPTKSPTRSPSKAQTQSYTTIQQTLDANSKNQTRHDENYARSAALEESELAKWKLMELVVNSPNRDATFCLTIFNNLFSKPSSPTQEEQQTSSLEQSFPTNVQQTSPTLSDSKPRHELSSKLTRSFESIQSIYQTGVGHWTNPRKVPGNTSTDKPQPYAVKQNC